MRRVSIAHCIEATLLCTLLVITALLVVTYPIQNVAFQAVSIEAPLALQLPFILWAALRFGTAGASLTLLVTTILSSWAVGHGHGQFQTLAPGASVLALQAVLIIVGVTFLTLATIIEERRQTERALSERLRFEELLARASATFIEPPSDRLDAAFVAWLERVGNFLAVDWARLCRLSDNRDNLEVTSAWAAQGFAPVPPLDVKRDFPWVLQRILNRESVIVGRGRTLPPDAPIDSGSLELFGFKSALVLPLIAGNRVLGAIGFGTAEDRAWPENLLTSLHLLADVFANAFVRKQTEDALRASELMKSAILDSMISGIAVIDPDGCVRAVNRSWKQFLDETDIQPANGLHLGENLLAGLRASPIARVSELVAGAESVLDGSREHFIFEHVSQAGGVSRWWTMQAVRLKGPNAGAIVNVNEITDFRLAEREAQRSRQELAHVTRVSTMGVLTVALAHQLNQPLGAIMSNAQAARRLLAKTPPDLGEVDEILADIVSDDRRASDVIRHVREFLHKGDPTVESVDLTAVIRDVAALVSGDAAIRNVVITLDVAQTPLMVRADLIQLQQVLLNLLLNALESIEDSAAMERNVLIRCQGSNGTAGEVSIRDSGAGFSPEARDLLFEGCRSHDRFWTLTAVQFGPTTPKEVARSSSSPCRSID
jgi:signal transduction histidine kinase